MTDAINPIPKELILELGRPNHARRTQACIELMALLKAGTEGCVELLLDRLGDNHPHVRSAAAESLTVGPPDEILEHLLQRLKQTDQAPGHRASLLYALGQLDLPDDERRETALLNELSCADADVRFQGVVTLNHIRCSSTAFKQALLGLIKDPDDEVSAVAATSAADFELSETLDVIVDRWRRTKGFAARQLALAAAYLGSDEVVPTLQSMVRSGIDGLEAVDALVHLTSAKSQAALLTSSRSWRVHPLIRARASVGLAQLGHPSARERVETQLFARRPEIRAATIDWLGFYHLEDWTGRLVAILKDQSSSDSANAASALGVIANKEALEALEQASNDSRPDVKSEALSAISIV